MYHFYSEKQYLDFLTGTPGIPTVSFSGSTIDLVACTTPSCQEGFGFEGSGSFTGTPFVATTGFYNNRLEPYNSERWELTAKDVDVPEPASMLGLLAVGALGAASKMKSAKKQKAQ